MIFLLVINSDASGDFFILKFVLLEISPTHKMVSFIFSLVETILLAPTLNGETFGFAYFVNEKILSMTSQIFWKSLDLFCWLFADVWKSPTWRSDEIF